MPLLIGTSIVTAYDSGSCIDERWDNFFQAVVRRGLLSRARMDQLQREVAESDENVRSALKGKQLSSTKMGLILQRSDYVRADGLLRRPDLNGRWATLAGSLDPVTGRLPVQFLHSGECLRILPHNVVPAVPTTKELIQAMFKDHQGLPADQVSGQEAVAALINIACLDGSSGEWRDAVSTLPPTTTVQDTLFERMRSSEPSADTVQAFIAALDTNFSMRLLQRGQETPGPAEGWHNPEFLDLCEAKEHVCRAVLKVAADDTGVQFYAHMCRAFDVLLGVGFPTAQRAAFYHNLALSYAKHYCTERVRLVNEQLIRAFQLACYENSQRMLVEELSTEEASALPGNARDQNLARTREMRVVVHKNLAQLLMEQREHIASVFSEATKGTVQQLTARAKTHLTKLLCNDEAQNIHVRMDLAICAMEDAPAEGVRQLEACLNACPRDEDLLKWAKVQSLLARLKYNIRDKTLAYEANEHSKAALLAFMELGQELLATCERMSLARALLGGLATQSLPLGEEHYAEAHENLLYLQNLPNATPDLHETIAPLLKAVKPYVSGWLLPLSDDASTANRTPMFAAEPTHELPLNADVLTCLLAVVLVDDLLAFSLACTQFNHARLAAGLQLSTLARSTLRSESLRVWGSSLGCPSPYPCWAIVHGLVSAADLNGRVCLVLGPPKDCRLPIELDTGWGSLSALQMPNKASMRNGGLLGQVMDMTQAARKLVRLSNLRMLGDGEMLRATRIMCKGESRRVRLDARFPINAEEDETRADVQAFREQILQSIWIPKQHSMLCYMSAWQEGGKEAQACHARACTVEYSTVQR